MKHGSCGIRAHWKDYGSMDPFLMAPNLDALHFSAFTAIADSSHSHLLVRRAFVFSNLGWSVFSFLGPPAVCIYNFCRLLSSNQVNMPWSLDVPIYCFTISGQKTMGMDTILTSHVETHWNISSHLICSHGPRSSMYGLKCNTLQTCWKRFFWTKGSISRNRSHLCEITCA